MMFFISDSAFGVIFIGVIMDGELNPKGFGSFSIQIYTYNNILDAINYANSRTKLNYGILC
jgi:hypothetical protein